MTLFKIMKVNKRILFNLKTKEGLKEMKFLRKKVKRRKEELKYIKQTFKNFIFSQEEINGPTLKLESK